MNFSHYDQLLTPVFILDKDLNICYFNFICSTVFNSSPRKLAKLKKIEELFSDCDYDFKKDLLNVEKTMSATVSPEISFGDFNGGRISAICKFIPQDGHIVVNLLDLSIEKRLHDKYKEQIRELKETHEEIVKADKLTAMGQIIASIGHEIGTPLVIVENRLNLLSQSLDEKNMEQSRENALRLKTEFDRIAKIFSNMRSILKNEEDRFEVVDLDSLIDDVLKLFRESDSLGNIKIEKKITGTHWVMVNAIKLQQVLVNMVKNSIDSLVASHSKKPHIIIQVGEDQNSQTQRIKIIDNGGGIAEELKGKIFDMFFTSKSLSDGVGLGLSISKKIIDAFSGQILLNDVKQGCEFEIVLPSVEMESFTSTNKYLSGESDIEGDKLLFVGDNVDQMNKIHNLLADKNYVLIFTDKSQDLEKLSEFLLVDYVIVLAACKVEGLAAQVIDLTGESLEGQLASVEEKFGKN